MARLPGRQRSLRPAVATRPGSDASSPGGQSIGVPIKTIRFWEGERLLPEPDCTPSGYRRYESAVVERLTFIRQAQAAGFRLDRIRQILEISDSGDRPCRHVTEVIERCVAEVEARIAELGATRTHLRTLARRAAAHDPAECRGYCSVIRPSLPVP